MELSLIISKGKIERKHVDVVNDMRNLYLNADQFYLQIFDRLFHGQMKVS